MKKPPTLWRLSSGGNWKRNGVQRKLSDNINIIGSIIYFEFNFNKFIL